MFTKVHLPYKTAFRVSDSIKTESGVTIPVIEGQLSQVDIVSPNGYYYKPTFWHKILCQDCVKEMIRNRECLGMIEHPIPDEEYIKTPYDKASHVVLSVWLQGDNPFGRFGLLNNEQGNAIKALVDVGVPVGVSTRGFGDNKTDERGNTYIDEDSFALITWDIVRNPNFSDLHMTATQVTDSLRSNPLYKELLDQYKLRDSADPKPLTLSSDMVKVLRELRLALNQMNL